jgi:hypothetical protein
MYNDARGGDPIRLGSCLSELEDQQFQAWVSMHELGLLDGHEITYYADAHRLRLVAPVDSERADETAREE